MSGRPARAAFWACAAASGWVLAGYPLALAARRARPWARGGRLPAVTIVVPAYRERAALARKLRALAGLDYPADRLELIVAVDEDEELARLAAAAAPGARVLFSPERRGKAAALNRALARARGEVVALTDANNLLEAPSLRAAVRHLADPSVWAVAGRRGEHGSAYARYEDLIKRLESRSGSVAAASGELIVARRERLPRFPEDVINDDLWLLCELVARGGRVVYEPRAASTEPPLDSPAELQRRARIAAGRWRLVAQMARTPPGFALRLASHKLGRLALPALLAGLLSSSLALARRPFYRAAALAQLAAYAPGAAALLAPPALRPTGRIARLSRELLVGCAGTALGLMRAVRRSQSNRWEPVR